MAGTRRKPSAQRTPDTDRIGEHLRNEHPSHPYWTAVRGISSNRIGERLQNEHRSHPHRYLLLLGMEPLDAMRLVGRVEEGFSYHELEQFQHNIALPMEKVAELVQIKPRTLIRRREKGRLRPDESDRLVRVSRVFGNALELFEGDADAARHWLSTPHIALSGAAPLDIAKTEIGAREVEDLIGRLEHGVFS